MSLDVTAGLDPSLDGVLAEAPADPQCRESENVWAFDDAGRFTLPRVAVEAISAIWEDRGLQGNVGFPDGRALNGGGAAAAVSPIGPSGQASVFGAGPLRLECIEPFRHWTVAWDGPMRDTTVAEQLAGVISDRMVDVHFELDAVMAVPPWFLGTLSAGGSAMLDDSVEGLFMNARGTRHEQLFRCTGHFEVGGEAPVEFSGTGLRIHRVGVRDIAEFWGHNWQSALFPSGRAFGVMSYAPRDDGAPTFGEAFVFDEGLVHPARIVELQWLTTIVPQGGDVTVVLETEHHGEIRIAGSTHGSTFTLQGGSAFVDWTGEPVRNPCTFHQGGAHYTWDGESAYGMVERSLPEAKIRR